MTDQADDAVEEEVDVEEPETEEEVEDNPEDVEAEEIDDEGGEEEPEEDSEPSYIEVEIDGETFSVPEKLKDKFMFQQDYTRKTQEVAETRKQLEEREQQLQAEREQVQQQNQDRRELSVLDYQLEQYENVDWAALQQQDPQLAQQHQFNYTQLKNQRDKKAQEVQQTEQQTLRKQQEQIAKFKEDSRQRLAKEVEGWSPELDKQVRSEAEKLGFSNQFFQAFQTGTFLDTVPMVKALEKAMKYDQMMEKAQKKKPKADIRPTRKVSGKKPGKKSLYSKDLTPEERIQMFRQRKSPQK